VATVYRKQAVKSEPMPVPFDNAVIRFLETKFRPGEFVAIGHGYEKKNEKKNEEITIAIDPGKSRTLEAWIADIKLRGLDTIFPATDGLFVRINPMTDGDGKADKDVACYRDVLVESDEGAHEDQLGAIRSIGLPISAIVFSGDRSVQAHVRIDAPDEATYRERFGVLRQFCVESLGLKIDEKNINPSRYSRPPGGRRTRRDHDTKEKILDPNGQPIIDPQTLLELTLAGKEWAEWEKTLPIDDGLPEIQTPEQFLSRRMALDPYLIHGLLREKSKMNFTSQSKARKTWLQIHQALCIGAGRPWLGHECSQAPVLYVNLELKSSTCNNRVLDICDALGIDPVTGHCVDFWNLRGKSADIAVMVGLIHHVCDWKLHYPLAAIREHVWKEAGKTKKEMDSQPGFFDIAYTNSPLLKRVADLPIFGAKAKNAQTYGAWKIAEIDIPEIAPGPKGHHALWA
jgi:hypothetical protein